MSDDRFEVEADELEWNFTKEEDEEKLNEDESDKGKDEDQSRAT